MVRQNLIASSWMALALLMVPSCDKGNEEDTSSAENEAVEESTGSENQEPAAEEGNEPVAAEPAEAAFEGLRNGYYESARFNVRVQVPHDIELRSATNDDSIYLEGPTGLNVIIANTQSVQLLDANFTSLNDRVSFDSVNLEPDRTEARQFNGLMGYRVYGDARLRGEDVPIYFISQAVQLPENPVMVTTFINAEAYFENSDTMIGVLDSIEALNLRPE